MLLKNPDKLLGLSNFYKSHLLFKFREEEKENWSTVKADDAVSGKTRTSQFIRAVSAGVLKPNLYMSKM